MPHYQHIILKPIREQPRAGWDKAFQEMHKNQDDTLLILETTEENGFEWE